MEDIRLFTCAKNMSCCYDDFFKWWNKSQNKEEYYIKYHEVDKNLYTICEIPDGRLLCSNKENIDKILMGAWFYINSIKIGMIDL